MHLGKKDFIYLELRLIYKIRELPSTTSEPRRYSVLCLKSKNKSNTDSLLTNLPSRMFAYHQPCPESEACSMVWSRVSLADLTGGGGGPVSLWSTGLPSRVHRNLQAESPPARRQPSSLVRVSQITKQWLVKKIMKKQ